MAKKAGCYSGIGGQAVLEGVMMKNQDQYAVAVRKPNGEIEVKREEFQGTVSGRKWKKLPFIRGVFNFVDSMILGTKTLNYSASFYDDEEEAKTEEQAEKQKKSDQILIACTTVFAVVLSVGIFVVLPYFLSSLLGKYIRNNSLIAIIEGLIRIAIFLLYVWGISAMKDIKRLYQYHGAEHKCINCIERGRELTVPNVMRSSRFHKRCGTSFLVFVMLVSVVLFFFIRVDSVVLRVVLRVALMPVVAGISYEIIRLAGRVDNVFINLLSAPGFWIQHLTTSEPDESMVEVAIASVEAVFDWKKYLKDTFDYTPSDDTDEKEEDAESSEV